MSEKIRKIKASVTGQIVFTVEKKENNLEWDVVSQASTVELSDKEILIAEVKTLDIEKFLLVKQLLFDGNSCSKIQKKTGIARSTIYRYLKYYCKTTILKLQKNLPKTF